MDLKGLLSVNKKESMYNGIVKNLRQVENNDNIFKRWINSLFKGVPFTLGKDWYVFVIKDNSTGKGHRADNIGACGIYALSTDCSYNYSFPYC